jgi:predicted metal-dependent phosphoesterase TrpH
MEIVIKYKIGKFFLRYCIMFVDLLGKTRVKLGLHTHTTLSDGHATPEEAARRYVEAGYDAIAITDHWKYGEECEIEGLKILSGCEYNMGGHDGAHVVHIIGVGMTSDPQIPEDWRRMEKTAFAKATEVVKKVKLHNGLAIVGHPAWSLNTPEQIMSFGDFDAVEIYNAVSECGMSDRAYSDVIIDQLATAGRLTNIIAVDDTHYYENDACRAWIMVEAVDLDAQTLIRAIRAGRFYATQGPEVHIEKVAPDKVKVICSPVSKVVFQSNTTWAKGRTVREDGLVEAYYTKVPDDRFVRAEVTDAEGKKAWTNYIVFG